MSDKEKSAGLRAWLSNHPVSRYSFLTLLIGGFVLGVMFWGSYNWAMEISNTERFCISCHEMDEYIFQEFKTTVHYSNPAGVTAICSDCHVPKAWHQKFVRKIQATGELYHKIMGSINTREKFEAKRPKLVRKVWRAMRSTDSRECRNCHNYDSMALDEQDRFAKRKHEKGMKKGETCIDCHQGIAHPLPDDWKSLWNEEFEAELKEKASG